MGFLHIDASTHMPLHIQFSVMKVDWPTYFGKNAPSLTSSLLEAFKKEDRKINAPVSSKGDKQVQDFSLREELASVPTKKRFVTLTKHIRQQAVQVLGIDPQKSINLDLPLSELGMSKLLNGG